MDSRLARRHEDGPGAEAQAMCGDRPFPRPDLRTELSPLRPCLGGHEALVIDRLGELEHACPPDVREDLHHAVLNGVGVLLPLVQAVESTPLAGSLEPLGGRTRSEESLIEALCRGDRMPVELSLPTGAVLGRALLVAKVNFFKSLASCFEGPREDPLPGLRTEIRELVDDGVFSKLADELLTGAVTNPRNPIELRRAAARHLLSLWSNCVRQPVVEFPGSLLSAWRARRRVREIYGTLVGTEELVCLLREECDEAFVRFFTRDQVTADQSDAFREFLFALPYEELRLLEEHMQRTGIPVLSREQVHHMVRKTIPRPAEAGPPSAEEVFASYQRRRLRSEYRSLSQSPGPHKTAEGYLMEFLLGQQIQRASVAPDPAGPGTN